MLRAKNESFLMVVGGGGGGGGERREGLPRHLQELEEKKAPLRTRAGENSGERITEIK